MNKKSYLPVFSGKMNMKHNSKLIIFKTWFLPQRKELWWVKKVPANYRRAQIINVQRTADHGVHRPDGYTSIYTAPVPKARRTSQTKSQEAHKRTSKKSHTMCFLAILEKLQTWYVKICLSNQDMKQTISKDKLMLNGEFSQDLKPLERTTGN